MRTLLITTLALIATISHTSSALAAGTSTNLFSTALQSAHASPDIALAIQVQCTDDKGIRSMRIFPNGVLIWNLDHQARIGREDRTALIDMLLKADFPAFKDHYGGKRISEKAGAPIIVLCSIDVQAGGAEKSSYQDANGERSKTFMALAASLLDRVEPLAAGGITAASLAGGLAMLSSGELATEALTLRLLRMPTDESDLGIIVSVESGQLNRRDYRPGVKVGDLRSSALTQASLETLLTALAQADFPDMPANLPASDVYQLKIRVLQHEHSVRARPTRQAPSAELDQASARLIQLVKKLISLE